MIELSLRLRCEKELYSSKLSSKKQEKVLRLKDKFWNKKELTWKPIT